ncbi:MAG: valine--tRNA ligase [Candidatus Omnitrophica bacterium]|nr:valine--tRNA ligase [Candidatus Omnitrophota bacterium]
MQELSKTYSPKDIEGKWYAAWEKNKLFTPKPEENAKPYTIVIPPPNVTGILHMGHALNNTIQDILIRWHRMKGDISLWIPGTDHAGIATQNVVERRLAKDGKKTRDDLGRERFIKEVWAWKEEHGSTIVKQLRRLGASCDWTRERFTMDSGLSNAVREAFVRLYEKGLIYRGSYIINWCPRCKTALSDEEAPHKDLEGMLYYIKYPIKGKKGEHVTVATTRPETMLGDTAVAVNPHDKRYRSLLKEKVILPLIERELSVIEDAWVDPEFGSGVVKITPAHDPNDFEIGKRHKLAEINILTPDGRVNENGKQYKGLDRFEARKKIVEDLKEQGLLVKVVSHLHAVGHCYRCHTVVEPYLSEQWFVRMKPLAEPAVKAVKDGRLKFYPDRWTKVYLNWMENIRDWCISRQIWWGHQIPVWYCKNCGEIIVSRTTPSECKKCGSKALKQDEDVLDTWFSSWLWPFSTLGWPEKTEDLAYFYPTSDLVTAPEIIFFWVARMIMAGCEFMGDIPFRAVYIHGTVRTDTGQKMSKSLGNIIDPLEIIDKIGADALRFSIILITATGQDVFLSQQKFDLGRNFTNKIWNAARFSFTQLEGFKEGSWELGMDPSKLSLVNRWILDRLYQAVRAVEKSLGQYRFNEAANEIYRFVWGNFCDWYLELIKPVLYAEGDSKTKTETKKVLFFVLDKTLRLLHPLMPFITEEIWQLLAGYTAEKPEASISLATWPYPEENFRNESADTTVSFIQQAVAGIRDYRAGLNIPLQKLLGAVLVVSDEPARKEINSARNDFMQLGRLEKLEVVPSFARPREGQWVSRPLVAGSLKGEVWIDVGGLVDIEEARKRLRAKIQEKRSIKEMVEKKLKNRSFLENAPADVIEEDRAKLENIDWELDRLLDLHNQLS